MNHLHLIFPLQPHLPLFRSFILVFLLLPIRPSFMHGFAALRPSTRLFRTSAVSMVAQKIDGTAIAKYAQTLSGDKTY